VKKDPMKAHRTSPKPCVSYKQVSKDEFKKYAISEQLQLPVTL